MAQQYKNAGLNTNSITVIRLVPHHFSAYEGHTFKFRGAGFERCIHRAVAVTAAIIFAATTSFACTKPQTPEFPHATHFATQVLAASSKPQETAKLDSLQAASSLELVKTTTASNFAAEFSLHDLMFRGVINWGGYKFTYYSQQVLPGGGLQIPGRHVNDAGFVSDGSGFIVLAGDAPLGTVFDTPFGAQGKIYDRGTVGNHLDVYTR